eukprot:2278650-Rhodomonas_salina.1
MVDCQCASSVEWVAHVRSLANAGCKCAELANRRWVPGREYTIRREKDSVGLVVAQSKVQ